MARAGWKMVRYADDFVILCRSQAEAQAALEQVREWVANAGLILHPEKTRLVNTQPPGGFDFLGYHFERGVKWPRAKSRKKLKERVREKTPRLDGRRLATIIKDVNRTLRGWYGYFQHRKANGFTQVDGWVRRRLRSRLETRRGYTRQGTGRAQNRWPHEWFANHGLRSLAELHAFTRTIVNYEPADWRAECVIWCAT
jgi:RNA-directed DNA polymerase